MRGFLTATLLSLLRLSLSVQQDDGDNDGEIMVKKIPCTADTEKGLQYRKISWYKVEEDSEGLIGLVLKDLRTEVTVLYKFANQSYEVDSDYSLVLPEATVRDCGQYRCTLWPPVGHYIQDGDAEFYTHGCFRRERQSKAVSGEKTGLKVNNTHLFLIISALLISSSVVIGCVIYRRRKGLQKTKQVDLF
ncbi:hypothetical protein AMEX_G15890 [Astyanax mexicanus]|uniref:Ig-like domain-containing protein n=1 Tax=Astyanax mexicanus TaxID=7994 RepID=A0A8B9KCV2_ASTMX|nr:hypothetical protein AMEX_G15890 [Astyanax mexicanus]